MTPIIRARIPLLWSTVREERWSNVFAVLTSEKRSIRVSAEERKETLSLLMSKLVFSKLQMSKNLNSSFMCMIYLSFRLQMRERAFTRRRWVSVGRAVACTDARAVSVDLFWRPGLGLLKHDVHTGPRTLRET